LAFTLIEVLIALSIFAMIITGIYSSWSGIHRATRIGLEASADAQRKRIAMRALEQSLGSVKYSSPMRPTIHSSPRAAGTPLT
jgi:prepilin-type N-terminal cleavage/methylation domain-containing protein